MPEWVGADCQGGMAGVGTGAWRFRVGRFVVMPNHVHASVSLQPDDAECLSPVVTPGRDFGPREAGSLSVLVGAYSRR